MRYFPYFDRFKKENFFKIKFVLGRIDRKFRLGKGPIAFEYQWGEWTLDHPTNKADFGKADEHLVSRLKLRIEN
ncbi:hypothetical protein DLM78_18250 [Leptospira stimsonii]|uniref:Uncharacterized protein n=1 Tax=Leptospira stimsonii TaxID=2202203 RepID=A0A8B3CLW9_9LEPT|nr:hypothetical protein DLM78_18250 [Leptospira stimsonii]